MLKYSYDPKALRYRQPNTGRFVSKTQIDNALNKYRAIQSGNMRDAAQQLINRQISRREAEIAIAKSIKNLWNTELVAGKGGIQNVAANDWLMVARELKQQYYTGTSKDKGKSYGLRQLFDAYERGEKSPNQLLNSMDSYARASKKAYWLANESMANKSNAYTMMQRFLGATDRHCSECISYSAAGLQPIGTLPLPSIACSCNFNCLCTVRYS